MWIVLQEVIPFLLIVVFATQIFIPAFFDNIKFFWIFRREKKDIPLPPVPEIKNELKDEVQQAKTKYVDVKNKVNENLKQAETLKDDLQDV